jgi:hypothetical protein
MTDQLGNATEAIAKQYGDGSGPNVAGNIGRSIQGQATAEDAALQAQHERNIDATNEAIATHEGNALERARNAVGDLNPQDMGETLIARLRQSEQEAEANKERLYTIAGQKEGAVIDAGSVAGLRGDVMRELNDAGVIADDPSLTPAAIRTMKQLDNVRDIPLPKRAEGAPPPAAAAPPSGGGLMDPHSPLCM